VKDLKFLFLPEKSRRNAYISYHILHKQLSQEMLFYVIQTDISKVAICRIDRLKQSI
jgi:hypothetical protein